MGGGNDGKVSALSRLLSTPVHYITKFQVRFVFVISLILCALCVGYRVHFSSVGIWASYMGRDGDIPGLISGEPKAIRSDEWMLGVPWILSQAHTNPAWSTENPAVGPGTSALLVGLPTNHWTALFRPAHWGFYFFDVERGFSWLWMWRSVVLFSALILLFMELNCGVLLSFAGAIWIFFSGFNQWWLASVSEMLAYWTLACLSVRKICLSQGWKRVFPWMIALSITAGGFGLCLYPPFQVPLAYLGVALLPFLTKRHPDSSPLSGLAVFSRFASVSLAVALSLTAVVFFLLDNAETVSVMEKTIYPGRRISLGGDLSIWRYVAGFFENNYSQHVFPPIAGNISEASSFILLWPLSLLLIPFIKERRQIIWFIPLIAYLVLSTLWGFFGVSESVATITGWSFVPTGRAFLGWGVGGAFLVVLAARERSLIPKWAQLALVAVAGSVFFWCAWIFPQSFPVGLAQGDLYLSATLLTVAVLGLVYRAPWALLITIFFLCAYPHSRVNPVMSGLKVITSESLVSAVKRFDPNREGRWGVFGSVVHAQLVKITGRDVINGSQYVPDLAALKALDPQGESSHVYNRYAHVTFTVAPEGTAPTFSLIAPDSWELKVDPCHPRFVDFEVRYLVWTNYQSSRRFSCYERVFVGRDFGIYKRVSD